MTTMLNAVMFNGWIQRRLYNVLARRLIRHTNTAVVEFKCDDGGVQHYTGLQSYVVFTEFFCIMTNHDFACIM